MGHMLKCLYGTWHEASRLDKQELLTVPGFSTSQGPGGLE